MPTLSARLQLLLETLEHGNPPSPDGLNALRQAIATLPPSREGLTVLDQAIALLTEDSTHHVVGPADGSAPPRTKE